MKKLLNIILFLFAVTFQNIGYSQDIIIKHSGDEIQAKITKITNNEIEFKKWTNLDGPIYIVEKTNVFMIKFSNGEKEIFSNKKNEDYKNNKQEEDNSPRFVEKSPAENNKKIIEKYNPEIKFAKTPKKGNSKSATPIMVMSDSSLVSTDELEMKILPTFIPDCSWLSYRIELNNKTDKTIYVDLANSYRMYKDGSSESIYNSEQTIVTHGESSRTGINLGGVTNALGIGGMVGDIAKGINIGNTNSNSVSTLYTSERILIIPPHTKRNLTEHKEVNGRKLSGYEYFESNFDFLRGILKKNGYILFNENESPYIIKFHILYSMNQDFSEYSYLYTKLYSRYILGTYFLPYGFFSNNLDKGRKEVINNIKEYIPDFWDTKEIIVGSSTFMSK